jgi:hypothetical protein
MSTLQPPFVQSDMVTLAGAGGTRVMSVLRVDADRRTAVCAWYTSEQRMVGTFPYAELRLLVPSKARLAGGDDSQGGVRAPFVRPPRRD